MSAPADHTSWVLGPASISDISLWLVWSIDFAQWNLSPRIILLRYHWTHHARWGSICSSLTAFSMLAKTFWEQNLPVIIVNLISGFFLFLRLCTTGNDIPNKPATVSPNGCTDIGITRGHIPLRDTHFLQWHGLFGELPLRCLPTSSRKVLLITSQTIHRLLLTLKLHCMAMGRDHHFQVPSCSCHRNFTRGLLGLKTDHLLRVRGMHRGLFGQDAVKQHWPQREPWRNKLDWAINPWSWRPFPVVFPQELRQSLLDGGKVKSILSTLTYFVDLVTSPLKGLKQCLQFLSPGRHWFLQHVWSRRSCLHLCGDRVRSRTQPVLTSWETLASKPLPTEWHDSSPFHEILLLELLDMAGLTFEELNWSI